MKTFQLISNNGKKLIGPLLLEPKIFKDKRGYFFESWNQISFNNLLSIDISFKQDNHSFSKKGVIRGLHYQIMPCPQGKLVRCSKGSIFDVAIDLRFNSSTFGEWASAELSDKNHNQLWIPEGFAHGFLTLSEEATVQYKATNFWSKEYERTIKWDDPRININWPIKKFNLSQTELSDKDLNAQSLNEAEINKDLFYL